MGVYRTVVGTDCADSSLRAVARAGALAGVAGAGLAAGSRGLNGVEGRLLGSVPADATRRSEVDVLVVHTTG